MRPNQISSTIYELGYSMLQTGCGHCMVVLDQTISICTEIFAEECPYVTTLLSVTDCSTLRNWQWSRESICGRIKQNKTKNK